MGYSHMFYAVDLPRLRSTFGSKDLELFEAVAKSSESLTEEETEALREIIRGECRNEPGTEHLYGYALKAICGYLGEMLLVGDVAAVRDHPYRSKLVANGSPVAIPYTDGDFPEIGYLSSDDLAEEHRLATETEAEAKRSLGGFLLRKMTGGIAGREPNAEEVAEDMQEYAETLKECMNRKAALVSFRH
jgi:hypothetical protein